MAHLTCDDIVKLAHLSQILITDNEAQQLAEDITAVLTYADFLAARAAALPTIPETVTPNRFRDDEARPGDRAAILGCAPETDGEFFIVPRVLKGS